MHRNVQREENCGRMQQVESIAEPLIFPVVFTTRNDVNACDSPLLSDSKEKKSS